MIISYQKVKVTQKGIGFLGGLTLLFAAAKLFGVIDWSWWRVFIPLWIIPAGVLVCAVIAFLIWVSIQGWEAHAQKRRLRRRNIGS